MRQAAVRETFTQVAYGGFIAEEILKTHKMRLASAAERGKFHFGAGEARNAARKSSGGRVFNTSFLVSQARRSWLIP